MAKHKETLLEVCSKATIQGNSISVRMLEYLSAVKNLPSGFRQLATDFLDLSRILWSIEAGLAEAAVKKSKLPADVALELEFKIRQLSDDLSVLNQMLIKFLEYESKGAIGRFQLGFRLVFSGTDIDKMRQSLIKDKEALRMSSMVFRWSVGDEKADSNVGIGYTGLAAALERLNNSQKTTVIPPMSASASQATFQDSTPRVPTLPLLPTLPTHEKTSPVVTPRPTYDSVDRPSFQADDRLRFDTPVSLHEDGRKHDALDQLFPEDRNFHLYRNPTTSSASRSIGFRNDSAVTRSAVKLDVHVRDDTRNSPVVRSLTDFKYPTSFIRVKIDPKSVPHWAPRPSGSPPPASSRASLLHAIQTKDCHVVERLLDDGADLSDPSLLIRACLNGDEEIVRLLLLFGSDPNAADMDGCTALCAATKTAIAEIVEMLMKYGADPNSSAGPDGETPLVVAAQDHNFELVHMLLMYNADASIVMAGGNTPLIRCINKTVPIKIVELMLDYETNTNAKNREGTTALFAAIQARRVDIMSVLLNHGANPNLPGPKHPLWPSTYHSEALQLLLSRGSDPKKAPGIMELATSLKNMESVSVLLDAGVSPNIKKDGIYTPLCSAIRDDSSEIFTLLLSNGADPNLPASEYPHFKCITHNRLHYLPQLIAAGNNLHEPSGILETAVSFKNVEAIKWLLRQGVDPNARTEDGCTALTTAIRENRIDLVHLLLENGADPNIRGEDWPLFMSVKQPAMLQELLAIVHSPKSIHGLIEQAVMVNQLESVKLLLKAGISVEDKTGGVFSPLTTALREQRKDLVRFLLYEANADPNAPGEHLPIIKAIRRCPRNDVESIEMLLDRGADINKMYRGWNAILQAVESGNIKILKVLLEKGNEVDMDVVNDDGRTIREVVIERGWAEALPLLFPQPESLRF